MLIPPLLLILAVSGSLIKGVATPTEAASVGAVCAMLLAASQRRFNVPIPREMVRTTTRVTGMVLVIVVGGSIFSPVFRGFGGDGAVTPS